MMPNDTPTSSAPASLVDLRELRKSLGSEAERIIPIVLDSFLKESAAYVAMLDGIGERIELNAYTRIVHNLKSSSASLGIQHFSTLCKEAEMATRAGDEARFRALLPGLVSEFGAVREAVAAALDAMLPRP